MQVLISGRSTIGRKPEEAGRGLARAAAAVEKAGKPQEAGGQQRQVQIGEEERKNTSGRSAAATTSGFFEFPRAKEQVEQNAFCCNGHTGEGSPLANQWGSVSGKLAEVLG